MNKKDKLLTLSSGRKFVIVEQCDYDGENYYLANEIINDNDSDNYKIFKITKDENGIEKIKNITDEIIIKSVTDKLEKKI